jgi:hypothetical protein
VGRGDREERTEVREVGSGEPRGGAGRWEISRRDERRAAVTRRVRRRRKARGEEEGTEAVRDGR